MSHAIQVNRPAIIDETIDDEVVVVDLHGGSYYSIRDSGVAVWHSLIEPTTPDRVIARIADQFGRPEEDVRPAIASFIEELREHGLIRDAEAPVADQAASATAPSADFQPPQLERFTDMEDLLMLDPVHDVDERGWPHAAPR